MENINLTAAEWSIMECLWEKSPMTGREVTAMMAERMGWNRSTTLTLLRRMEAKSAVASDAKGSIKTFFPLIRREEAATQETESFLNRVYKGSLSLMVSSLARKQSLPQKEIDDLYELLKRLEAKPDA